MLRHQVVYVETFKRLCLVVSVFDGEHLRMNLVNTDTSMKPEEVLRFYQARFQQEFLFRDAKQQTGLGACQSRDEMRLNFYANAVLTAVNIAQMMTHTNQPFSILQTVPGPAQKSRFHSKNPQNRLHRRLILSGVLQLRPNSENL